MFVLFNLENILKQDISKQSGDRHYSTRGQDGGHFDLYNLLCGIE